MFTQYYGCCSEGPENTSEERSRALVVQPQEAEVPAVSAALATRLRSAAAAAGISEPIVLPGASVTLFNVHLPLKSARQRRKALTYALDGKWCNDAAEVRLSPARAVTQDHYLVAVCDDSVLEKAGIEADFPGIAVPDTMGIPCPEQEQPAWNIWCEAGVAYVRQSDGTGFVCRSDSFTMLWQQAGKPDLFCLTPKRPAGLPLVDLSGDPPQVDPRDLALDLRQGPFRYRRKAPRRFLRVAAAAVLVGIAGHLSLMAADAQALSTIADRQVSFANAALAEKAPGLTADQPLRLIAARFSNNNPTEEDHFMEILAHASRALRAQGSQISFRELRYGAREGVLTLLVQGSEFGPLQTAEAALVAAGLQVTSGTATATEGGAEVLLQVRSAP